jgi:hypothetical protein
MRNSKLGIWCRQMKNLSSTEKIRVQEGVDVLDSMMIGKSPCNLKGENRIERLTVFGEAMPTTGRPHER